MVAVEVHKQRRQGDLLRALARLSDADAVLVLLAMLGGVTYREIAEARGEAPATIARRLRAALAALREAETPLTVAP